MINRTHFRFNATGKIFPIISRVSTHLINEEEHRYTEAKEYEIKLEIASRFHCPYSAYELARKTAEESIIRMIFKDVLFALTDIKQAMYSGQTELVNEVCDRLEKEILE
jgi:hypothetical protein